MKVHQGENVSELKAVIYTDANLPSTGKSQGGYILAMMGPKSTYVPVSWSSKREPITVTSTMASERLGDALYHCGFGALGTYSRRRLAGDSRRDCAHR